MSECPITLEKVLNQSRPGEEKWQIAPSSFNPGGICTVKITVDGNPPIPITTTSSLANPGYGDFHVGGLHLQQGSVTLDPPIPTSGSLIWDVTCPDCTKQLRHDFGGAPQPQPQPKPRPF